MNYTDEQLLAYYKNALIIYINEEILSLNDFKSFLNIKPKSLFKIKGKKYFEDSADESEKSILKHQDKELKDYDAINKIDNL